MCGFFIVCLPVLSKSRYCPYFNLSTLLLCVLVVNRKFFLKPINGCYLFLFISCSVYFLRFMSIGTIYICIFLVYNNYF